MNENLVTRKEAALQMGISECTISRCVRLGAPVHRRGSTGHRYLVDVSTFIKWMEAQGGRKAQEQKAQKAMLLTTEEMAARRKELMRQMKAR